MTLKRPLNFYKTERERTNVANGETPVLSHDLESVRKYQFELIFDELPTIAGIGQPTQLTLAAKSITSPTMSNERIQSRRVNDPFYFPGQTNQEQVTVVFDQLLKDNNRVGRYLYEWYSAIYDSRTGEQTKGLQNGVGTYKAKLFVYELNGTQEPVNVRTLLGVFPTSYKPSELAYETNEFAMTEVVFSFDAQDFNAPANARFSDVS